MIRRPRILPEIVADILRLHQHGLSQMQIAERCGVSSSTVHRLLHGQGVTITRSRQRKWLHCVDCGVCTDGSKRCPLHKRLRLAELGRGYYRVKHKVSASRAMVDDGFYEHQKHPLSSGELRKKKSGHYGPMVIQLETA